MLGVGRAGPLGAEDGPPRAMPDERPPGALEERRAAVILMSVEGIGPVTFYRLLAAHRSAAAVLELARSEAGRRLLLHSLSATPAGLERMPAERPRRIVDDLAGAARNAGAILERLAADDLAWLTLDDQAYPGRLRLLELPPPVLFLRGDPAALDAASAVAVVGTRRPSDAGRRLAARIADALARLGTSVISGLAVGVDGAAHAATIEAGGRTVAVLGSGHARLFPFSHRHLAEQIVAGGGALVSELPPTATPSRGTFPRRNRLISGLADATVVVEAAARSGALITAAWALEQGRECFAVPGSIDAPTSAGCLAFLREYPGQVRIVAGIAELIDDLGLAGAVSGQVAGQDASRAGGPSSIGARPSPAAVLASLGPAEAAVATILADGSATIDDLARGSGFPVATVLGTLTVLELRGLACGGAGRYRLTGALAALDPTGLHSSSPGPPPGGGAQGAEVAASRRPVLR